MKSSRVAAACVLLGAMSAILAGQDARSARNRWWRDPAVQRELALDAAQIQTLDIIFQRDLPARRALYRSIEQLDAELQHVIERGDADEATVVQLSERVETMRRERNIRRSLMLLAMRKALTPGQRAKVAVTHSLSTSLRQ